MSGGKTQWVGSSVKRREDRRLLTGTGRFIDDLSLPNLYHAAILRSPFAHARVRRVDVHNALKMPGVVGILTGEDVAKMSQPFPVGVQRPPRYFAAAADKVRYVGEPVAVIVATDRYRAEDGAEAIEVEYEPLSVVVDPERALEPDAPVLHEEIGTNVAWHRSLQYGDVDRAFQEADCIVTERFVFPKYSSTPMETFGVVASFAAANGHLTIWSNFQGPFTMYSVVAKALNIPEQKIQFIVPPDIGGGFGIKTSMFPYLALIGLAAIKTGVTVKWIEDRFEHLLSSSSGTDRVSELAAAVKKDGTILGLRAKILDNVGAYIRAPEPGCILRPLGNFVGAYKIQSVAIDGYTVHTNKSMTGPNRGYGCQQHYFGLERLVDLIAAKVGLDPAEVRRRNFIQPGEFPYTTPTGGIYDSGDYPAALAKALEMGDYRRLREEQQRARKQGRLVGIGICTAVDPSVSNMGYVTVALDPQERSRPDYLPKSGALEAATVQIQPLGQVSVVLSTTPQGQGHETIAAQIVADELGISPEEVEVVEEFDTSRSVWSVSSGSYSSRFAAIGASAVALAARKVKEKLLRIAAYKLGAEVADVELWDRHVVVKGSPEQAISLKRIAGAVHWHPQDLPAGMEPGLQETAVFGFSQAGPPDTQDRINSSNTYGFIAEVVVVEVDPETGEPKILKYISVHDAGTIINPQLVEGQIYGGALHGIGGALYEELAYDGNGQLLTGTFVDYLCPTAAVAPKLDIGHVVSPSPFTVLGSKGCGESSSMTAPAAIANAVADALAPLGVRINELPLTPDRLWRLLQTAKGRESG